MLCSIDSIELVKIDKINEEVQKFINDNMMYDANKKLGVKYLGGHVKHPVMGRYLGVVTYDVSSMYPTMANIYNISPETVNCECCKNNPKAKVPDGVMKAINDYLLDPKSKVRKHEARPWHYWICLNQTGKFAQLMQYYFDKKLEYKKQGLTLKEKAIKIMANSSYGAFGNAYFEYTDPRCTELITAFGQYTIRRLEEFAGADNTLYIDTDSLYLRSENKDIIKFAKDELGVKLEVDKRWKIIFLTNNSKNYMGVTEEGTLEHTTLTGMKSNYPSIINEIAENVICKELLELFITNPGTALDKVLQYVRDGFKRLTQECPSNLVVAKLFEKDLWDHKNNNEPKQIYSEILQDCGNDENLAKSRSMGGEVFNLILDSESKEQVSKHAYGTISTEYGKI
jgi:DNA polymerase elongation subunit (family B)